MSQGSLLHSDWCGTRSTAVLYIQHSHHISAWVPPNKDKQGTFGANQECEEYLHDWIWSYQWWLKEYDSLYRITGVCIYKCYQFENLKFSSCGATFPSNITVKRKFVYPHDYKSKLAHTLVVALYFLQTVNVTISEVTINNSTGAELLGINMLGLSNISQTTFSGNKPNCLIIFLDIPSTSEIILPTIFNIVDSQIISFKSTLQKNYYYWGREYLGFSATLAQNNIQCSY